MLDSTRDHRLSKRKQISPAKPTAEGCQVSSSKTSKASHKSSACTSCQKKRRRCNGSETSPCSECVKFGTPCIFDRNGDGRRRPQRALVKKDQELLHRLFEALKTWTKDDLDPLLSAIAHDDAAITDLESLLENSRPSDDLLVDGQSVTAESEKDSHGLSTSYLTDTESLVQLPDSSRGEASSGSSPYLTPGAVRSYNNLPMSSAVLANHFPPAVQRQQLNLLNRPEYLCLPTILDTDNRSDPLTMATLSFLYKGRNQILKGHSVRELLSVDGIDLALFFRDRVITDDHTVSTWACEMAKTFSHLSFTSNLSWLHSIGTFMRWLTLPCQETWEMMNPLMRPLKSQIMVPHESLYVDLCHIPQLRLAQLTQRRSIEGLMARPDWVDCHWQYGQQGCVEIDQSGSPKSLSQPFIQHISDIRNWSVHQAVLTVFPELGEPDNYILLHGDILAQ